VWWKIDRTFQVPSAYLALTIDTPLDLSDTYSHAMLQLYTGYLRAVFQEELDAALHSGFETDISPHAKGLNIQIYGFSSKISAFFNKIVNCPCLRPKSKKTDLAIFERSKELLMTSLKNAFE
jgi:secreted Zn-dependent insulinase-like peptidase